MMDRTPIVIALLLAGATGIRAQERSSPWPQYLGPSRNGIGAAIPASAKLTVAWKKPLPSGGAGIVVSGDRVYTLGSDGEQDLLFAFNPATGAEEWRLALGKTHADATANGPASTPALAGDLVVAITSTCQVQAVNSRTRQFAWTQDLGAFKSRFIKRGGCSVSPLLAGDNVVVQTGATEGPRLVAFDAATGSTRWTATDLPNSNSGAPGWMNASGGLILYHHAKASGISGITALNAATGTTTWQIDGRDGMSGATPVPVGTDRVLLETWQHVSLYDLASRAPLWTTRDITAQDSPAVYHNGHIYAFGGQSGEFLTCVDARDGKVKWSERIYRGHVALAGETLVILSNASGFLRLVAADPTAYRELAKVQVLAPGARTFTPPSIAGNRIFVRNLEEIVAVDAR